MQVAATFKNLTVSLGMGQHYAKDKFINFIEIYCSGFLEELNNLFVWCQSWDGFRNGPGSVVAPIAVCLAIAKPEYFIYNYIIFIIIIFILLLCTVIF